MLFHLSFWFLYIDSHSVRLLQCLLSKAITRSLFSIESCASHHRLISIQQSFNHFFFRQFFILQSSFRIDSWLKSKLFFFFVVLFVLLSFSCFVRCKVDFCDMLFFYHNIIIRIWLSLSNLFQQNIHFLEITHKNTHLKKKKNSLLNCSFIEIRNFRFSSIFLTSLEVFSLHFSESCFLVQDSGSLCFLFWLVASIFCSLASRFCFLAFSCIDYRIFCRLLSLLCFLICKVFRFWLFHQRTRSFKAVQSILCNHLRRWWYFQLCFILVCMWFFVSSFYLNIDDKKSKGRNWIESNIRITSSRLILFISSANISFSSFNFSTLILSVSHNRSMNKYFLLSISDSQHCILLSVRSCLVSGSLFVSCSNWLSSSTSFCILFD